MRINIIGPSGSGKTTLAKKLSKKFNIPHTNLDYIFYIHHKTKARIKKSDKEWKDELKKILIKKSWIIEGINPINNVLEAADEIIFLNTNLATSLHRQWKRYFTDKKQRLEHGFVNNLKLSRYILRQHLDNTYKKDARGKLGLRMKLIKNVLSTYKEKLVVIQSDNDLRKVLNKDLL